MTQFVRPHATAVLLAFAMVISAAIGGALIGRVGLADAVVGSGDKPITVNIDLIRIRDTRTVFGGPIGGAGVKLGGPATEVLQVAGTNGIPADAKAVCINLTVLDSTGDTFVTAYGADPRPNASTVNPGPGDTSVNGVIVPLDATGKMRIYNNVGSVNYFIDVSCYTTDHHHDDRYYQESETYTKAQVDAAIAAAVPKVYFARVNQSNSILAQSGGITFTKVDTGLFRLTFPVDISDCSWAASAGGATFLDGLAFQVQNAGVAMSTVVNQPSQMQVYVYDDGAAATAGIDFSASIQVTCLPS